MGDSLALVPTHNVASLVMGDSLENSTAEVNTYIDNSALYLDMEIFSMAIQDRGVSYIDEKTGNRFTRKPSKKFHNKYTDRLYADIHKLSQNLFELYLANTGIFVELQIGHTKKKLNKTRERDKIAQWIINDRLEKDTVFILEQRSLLMKAYAMWGPQEAKPTNDVSMNTRVRLFGILLGICEYRDDLNILVKNLVNGPSQSRDSIFAKVALLMNDENVKVANPPGWEEALVRKEGNHAIPCSELWKTINGNNKVEIKVVRSGLEVKGIWKNTRKLYNDSMRMWVKETGGGSGDPENCCENEQRNSENIARYDKQYGVVLAWIYMWDKSIGGLLKGALLAGGGEETGDMDIDASLGRAKRSHSTKMVQSNGAETSQNSTEMAQYKGAGISSNMLELGLMSALISTKMKDMKSILASTLRDGGDSSNLSDITINTFDAIDKCEDRKRKLEADILKSTDGSEIARKKIYIKKCEDRIEKLFNTVD